MFTAKMKDKAVETTCSNLVMAGLLMPAKVAKYMCDIGRITDTGLALELINSKMLLRNYYKRWAKASRN